MLLNKKAQCGQISLGGEDFPGKLDTRRKLLMIFTSDLKCLLDLCLAWEGEWSLTSVVGSQQINCNSAPCTRPELFIDGVTKTRHTTKGVVKKKYIYAQYWITLAGDPAEALRIFISIFHV